MPDPMILLLGAGGHAASVYSALRASGKVVAGFVAPGKETRIPGLEWWGDDAVLDRLDPAEVTLVNGIGTVTAGLRRWETWSGAHDRGFRFETVIHPSAIIPVGTVIGEGTQILAGAIIGVDVRIDEDVIINTGAIIDHHSWVGAHAHVAPGAVLAGDVTIGPGAHIGLGARVIQGVTIGSNSTIGAGAVVLSDIPDGVLAVGVPAQVHRG